MVDRSGPFPGQLLIVVAVHPLPSDSTAAGPLPCPKGAEEWGLGVLTSPLLAKAVYPEPHQPT